MSIASYFLPVDKDKRKGPRKHVSNIGNSPGSGSAGLSPGLVNRTRTSTPDGKKSRSSPYPDISSRNSLSTNNVLGAESSTEALSRTSSTFSTLKLVPATSSGNLEPTSTLTNLIPDTFNPDTTSFTAGDHPRYAILKRIADDTISAIEGGSFQLNGVTYDLGVAVKEMREATECWSPNAPKMVNWTQNPVGPTVTRMEVSVLEISTLEGARFLEMQLSSSSSNTAATASPYFPSNSNSQSTSSPHSIWSRPKIGILNFASATKPGGGFLSGSSAQEESIARSSTLYYSLTTRNADEFYRIHKKLKGRGNGREKGKSRDNRQSRGEGRSDRGRRKGRWGYRGKEVVWIPEPSGSASHSKPSDTNGGQETEQETETEQDEEEIDRRDSGFYTHAMVYSPSVLLFRDDAGSWLAPLAVDVLTSAAVNAGDVHNKYRSKNMTSSERDALENRIRKQMKERMARILHLFAVKGVRNVVLGSFGTGVFRNDVEVVVGLWKELLVDLNAPFQYSFDRVVFAVLGKQTFETFDRLFAKPSKRPTALHRYQ